MKYHKKKHRHNPGTHEVYIHLAKKGKKEKLLLPPLTAIFFAISPNISIFAMSHPNSTIRVAMSLFRDLK